MPQLRCYTKFDKKLENEHTHDDLPYLGQASAVMQ